MQTAIDGLLKQRDVQRQSVARAEEALSTAQSNVSNWSAVLDRNRKLLAEIDEGLLKLGHNDDPPQTASAAAEAPAKD